MAESSNQQFREDMLKAINALQLVVKDLYNEVNLIKFSDSSITSQIDALNSLVRDGGNGKESLVIRVVKVEEGQKNLEINDQTITGQIQILKETTEDQLQEVSDTINKLSEGLASGESDVMVAGIEGKWRFAVQGLVLVGLLASLSFNILAPGRVSPEELEQFKQEIIDEVKGLTP